MSITLRGTGSVDLHVSTWCAIRDIGRELGWVPEYEKVSIELGYWVDDIPDHNARALAKILYRVIHMIEEDSLSESLVDLVKEARVGNIRDVADLAYMSGFYAD